MAKDAVLDALQKASKGLLFPSESEAELEPFAWKDGAALTAEALLKLSGTEADADVEETTLEAQLSGIKVYKVGADVEKAVYIVGKTRDKRWAGLKTTVVET
jgi:hypothetical protein